MKIKILNDRNKYFASILLFLTLAVSITIFTVSIILYMNFENIGRSIVFNSARDNLHEVSYSATFMTDTVKSLATQIYFNADTTKLLYDFEPDTQEINIGLNRLNSYRTTMPLIHSIYIYNGKLDTFYSNLNGNYIKKKDQFFDQDIVKILNNFDSRLRLLPIPRRLSESYFASYNDLYSDVYTYIFFDLPIKDGKVDRAVILNISEEWMRKTISSMDILNKESTTFIIDSKGVTVCSNNKDKMLSDYSSRKYIKEILNSKSASGYFVENVEGIKSLVTFVSSSPSGWRYIRITPYDTILKRINEMRYTTMLICFFILLAGLLLSYITSKSMYKPIKSMLNNFETLAAERRNSLYQLKQEFLRKILMNEPAHKLEALSRDFQKYQFMLDPKGLFLLELFTIDHFYDFCREHSHNDRSLLKFGIMNIISELCTEFYTCETVDMSEKHMALILNIPANPPVPVASNIETIIKKVQESVKKYLNISLSATVCFRKGYYIDELSSLYNELLEFSQYRLYCGHNSIIYIENTIPLKSKGYQYPQQREKLLIDALMLGKTDNAMEQYMKIIEYISDYSFTYFNSALLRLIFSINFAIENVEKAGGIPVSYNFNEFISELNNMETIETINSKFSEMFSVISEKLEERKGSKQNVIVDKVISIINDRFSDSCLSLEGIADMFNMSSVYLGRQFKKITGKSVSDYTNELRLEKAKTLLGTSMVPIGEIADKVGFSSSNYFYIYFKKAMGITPSEFRQNISKL